MEKQLDSWVKLEQVISEKTLLEHLLRVVRRPFTFWYTEISHTALCCDSEGFLYPTPLI